MTQVNAEHLNKITQGDSIEEMRKLADDSVDLIVIDPPYNIGKDKRWDKWKTVDYYVEFMTEVFKESERVLKPTGSFYWFHNDMTQVRKLMDSIENDTNFVYKNFITWNKRYTGSPRKYYFDNVIKTENSRSYRPMSEYCLFYTFQKELTDVTHDVTKFPELRKYFANFLSALGLTKKAVMEKVGQRCDHCLRSTSTQWDLPTKETYDALSELPRAESFVHRSYEHLRSEYEVLRREYDKQRYTYNHQATHHDVWDYEVAQKLGHVTPKPVELIENIILHSSNEGDVVLDCFLGSGTTAIAAINTNRNFIGIEREPEYVAIANQRIVDALQK